MFGRRKKRVRDHGEDGSGQTDRFLVEQCLQGDSQAWHCLVRRYKRLVYHFPNQAKLPGEDCDDVFQDTFLALYQRLNRIKHTDDLAYWLSKVAQRNTWRMVQKRQLADIRGNELYDVEDPKDIPQKNLERKVQQSKVRQGLNKLGPRCRLLLMRLFYEAKETDYKLLSEELGIAVGSIGPTRNRCLLKFKKILAKLGINEKNVSNWLG